MQAYGDNNATPAGRSVTALVNAWGQLDGDIGRSCPTRPSCWIRPQRADKLSQQMPLLNSSMDQVTNILQQRNGSAEQMLGSSRQMLLADRMVRRVQEVLQGGDSAQAAADGLARDAQLYGTVLKGLTDGNADAGVKAMGDANARKILTDMQGNWAALADPIAKLVSAAAPIADVKNAGNQASLDSQNVLLRANELSDQIGKLPYRRLFPNVWWGVLGAAGAVAFALLLVVTLVRDQRKRFQDRPSSTSATRRRSCACWTKWDRSPKAT